MLNFKITEYDKKIYSDFLMDFLPDKIIDVHTHIWEEGTLMPRSDNKSNTVSWPFAVAPYCTMDELEQAYGQLFPGKTVKPVLMTSPKADRSSQNGYALKCAKERGLPALYCINYNTSVEEIRQAMADGFCGIKPYVSNAPWHIPSSEIRIYDFLTPEHLSLMNELGGIVMLHIGRPGRLKDPVNIAQLMEIDVKYPNARVIVAHIGRAYIESDIGDAFDTLKHSKNLLFDFSANTLDKAMIECVRAVGSKRLLFGSDMPITTMRMYRVEDNGIYVNVVPRGMYFGISGDKNMRETDEKNITTFIYEELLALKRCAGEANLSSGDIENIMYKNAANLFGIKI